MPNQQAIKRIGSDLDSAGKGGPRVHYRMRDWLISRQRYWGAPIPIIHCPACGEVAVPEDQLPVLLPEMRNFEPDGSGRSPLGRAPEFVNTACPQCGEPAQRETDTMGGFACSSWYFLRYSSPHYHQGPFEPQAVRYWAPVDLYVGGAEHAVLHLLYARFWTKVMADAGLISFREPFSKLRNQGQLLAPDGRRMSKSMGNVITPDEMIEAYSADALRIYEMFMAPFDQDVTWRPEGIQGAWRFVNRVWTLVGETYSGSGGSKGEDPLLEQLRHKTIRRVGERIETFRLNTMVSALMEFVNVLADRQRSGQWQTAAFHRSLETLMILLAPGAPHIADELWRLTGHKDSVHCQAWPTWDVDLARDEIVQIPVQVNGRLRDVVEVPAEAEQEQVLEVALACLKVQQHIGEKAIRQVFFVAGKTLNIVLEK
jgi:leucyl-tRNA synthetase